MREGRRKRWEGREEWKEGGGVKERGTKKGGGRERVRKGVREKEVESTNFHKLSTARS